MKKILKILCIILMTIIVLATIFFVIDYNRVQKQKIPMFCINKGVYADGGTKEYIGLGYKIIKFHTLTGYNDTKIGTWFMKYDDFESEIEEQEKQFTSNTVRGEIKVKKKKILSILFIVDLIPMFFYQYGTARGVSEVRGTINLVHPMHPIGIISTLLYFIGVWYNFRNEKIKKCLPYIGMVGIIISELVNFLTWMYPCESLLNNIKNCYKLVFPMFYVGVITSILVIIIYRIIDKKIVE